MADPLITQLEDSICSRLESRIAYLRSTDGSRCRGVRDAQTAIRFAGVEAPAVLVQWRGARPSGFQNIGEGTVGLPVSRQFDYLWRLFIVSSSFTGFGEGRRSEAAVAGAQGTYRMVEDIFDALQGYQVDQEHDSRLLALGEQYDFISEDGRIVYISDWRHWVRRVGLISS